MKVSLSRLIAPVILGLLICTIPARSAAGDDSPSDPPTEQLFRAGEIHGDAFGSARTSDLKQFRFGYGSGVAWYPWRTAGLRAEVTTENPQHAAIDGAGLTLVARFPIDRLRIALDYGVGAGAHFDGNPWVERGDFTIHAEIGPRVRLTTNWDLWVRAQGVRNATTSIGEHLRVIAGTSVSF